MARRLSPRLVAFVAETIRTTRAPGACGLLVVRANSAFCGADVINACQALKARSSVTVRMNAFAKAAIAAIDEAAWTAIKYPKAVWDEEGQCWISDAEIAEIGYTVFTSKPKKHQEIEVCDGVREGLQSREGQSQLRRTRSR